MVAYRAPFRAIHDVNFPHDDEDDDFDDGDSANVTKMFCSCLQNSI